MSNNSPKYQNCPPIMQDGRYFTDYRPSSEINREHMKQAGTASAYEYKLYLQKKGQEVIKRHRETAKQEMMCSNCSYAKFDPTKSLDPMNAWSQSRGYFHYGKLKR